MTRLAALASIALAACSFGANASETTDALPASDGGGLLDGGAGCQVSIAYTPTTPQVGDHVHASAVVSGADGVPTYAWTLDGSAWTEYEAADGSAIGFDATTAGTYALTVTLGDFTSSCAQGQVDVPVIDATGPDALYRLRVVTGSDVAPPFEAALVVHAGTPAERDVELEPGEPVTGAIANGAAGVPAYIQFVPSSGGPAIEAYAAMTGAFTVRTAIGVMYVVNVVPEVSGLAPRSFAWTYPMPASFALDAGQAITGSVLAPGGGGLADAQVELASGDLPSTIATTAADGSFTALATFTAGSQITATVVPPPTSGLARLAATSTFDLSTPLQIVYGAATPCDLGGDSVQRGGVGQAGAQVTIVGAASTAGTIGGVAATGSVFAAATANASGVLPSLPVPRATGLHAVVQLAANDVAVAALDTSTCAAQPIVAPAEVVNTGTVTLGGTPLANVRIEATPVGLLAAATLTPVDVMTGADGSFSIALAAGGSYDVRVGDPRAAPFAEQNVASIGSIALAAGLAITGTVSVDGGGVVPGAAVELLCASCTGVAADRPIAQAATDTHGGYVLTVSDPGSM
ncbi:MAG TPA: hypothetical protein VH143_20105 [Kofleriaceae bacterium]|nr:hypothetical protein [Kofleriaceae bacterium]